MLSLVRRVAAVKHAYSASPALRWYSTSDASLTPPQHEPLNILFCGSDEFSIFSLNALQNLKKNRPDRIGNIEVICRPDKPGGRGLKQIHQVPIKPIVRDLDLTLHQIDSFRSWIPPTSIDLIIAVSFGLLVPSRILSAAKYGGLNVHPSLLPDLRGPAPIIHTLLKRREYTGVTVQTMHPTKFDHGVILAQTPVPGLKVAEECTPDELRGVLGEMGAEMLCRVIEDGRFVPPAKGIRDVAPQQRQLDHAPKITAEDRHIDWTAWTADEILLRSRVLGRLWDTQTYSQCMQTAKSHFVIPKRIAFEGPWRATEGSKVEDETGPGMPILIREGEGVNLGLWTCDGKIVIPSQATIDGQQKGHGWKSLTMRLLDHSQHSQVSNS